MAADREAAEMLGINVNFTISMTFFLGSALAGVAGVMGGLLFNQVTNTIGFIVGLKAFTAAVVGGIGSLPGAMSAACASCCPWLWFRTFAIS